MITVFFVVFITTLFCYYDSKRHHNRGLILSAFLIIVYGGIRYDYGSDYPSYLRMFQALSTSSFEEMYEFRTEVGWNVLNMLCKPIGFFGMVFLITAFETIIIYRFIGKYVDPKYHWFANICYTFNTSMMLLGFSMMRQFLAMCIVLLAVDFVIKRKWLYAVPIVVIAGLFHYSAFVFIPVCFIGYLGDKKLSKSWGVAYTMITVIFYFLGGPLIELILPDIFTLNVFEDYGDVYGSKYGKREEVSMFSIARIYGALLFVFLMTQFKNFNFKERNISLLYSVGVLLGSLVSVNAMAGRINLYFSFVGIAALPFIVKYLKDTSMKVAFVFVYLLFLLYRFIVFFNTPIWESFIHYHTIFEQPWQ